MEKKQVELSGKAPLEVQSEPNMADVFVSPHRSGLTFPPWGNTRMENTSWPSWKNIIWRMALTWVRSAALLMASCKPRPAPTPSKLCPRLVPPSPNPRVYQARRHCGPPIVLGEDVEHPRLHVNPLGGAYWYRQPFFFFCQILFPLPHSSPDFLNWGREGTERYETCSPRCSLLRFFYFPMNWKTISLFATAEHTILFPLVPS